MPYLQPNTNNQFGFMPATGVPGEVGVNLYLVSSSEGDINLGDILVASSVAQVRGTSTQTGAWSSGIMGVAASILLANTGSTAATISVNSSQMVLVYDDPEQVFVGCETSSGTLFTVNNIGYGVNVITSGKTGSTGPSGTLHRSVQAVGTATTSGTTPFRLIGLHPVDANTSSGPVRKWLLQVNNYRGAFATITT